MKTQQLRYSLCISFYNSNRDWNLASMWDISEDFKSKADMLPYLEMIDDSVKKANIYDHANKTFEILKG